MSSECLPSDAETPIRMLLVENQIVLLDLNMPGMNGHEFLAELRKDAELCQTIVFC